MVRLNGVEVGSDFGRLGVKIQSGYGVVVDFLNAYFIQFAYGYFECVKYIHEHVGHFQAIVPAP